MKILIYLLASSTLLLKIPDTIDNQTLTHFFLDNQHNIRAINDKGEELLVTETGNASELQISSNGKTVTWRKNNRRQNSENQGSSDSEIFVYRNRKIGLIRCEPQIRDYWFWHEGEEIAIDCGGEHFSGREILYDSTTLFQLENFDQAEIPPDKRPKWSKSGDNFSEEK